MRWGPSTDWTGRTARYLILNMVRRARYVLGRLEQYAFTIGRGYDAGDPRRYGAVPDGYGQILHDRACGDPWCSEGCILNDRARAWQHKVAEERYGCRAGDGPCPNGDDGCQCDTPPHPALATPAPSRHQC